MRRLFAIAASVAILLALSAPAVLAADPSTARGSFIFTANGRVDVPGDQHVDVVMVVNGTATISGDVDTAFIAGGSATFTGATVDTIVVIDGSAVLDPGTVVSGDVRTLQGSVTQQPGAVVQGTIKALDVDLAAFAILMIPVLIVLMIGFVIAGLAAALAVAAFGSRQVRQVEALISQRPGPVLVAGIAGTFLLPALAILLMLTVVGAPIGFAVLFLVLPGLAFLGWIVAAIWVGDWLLERTRGAREPGRPYRAALLGIVVLGLLGIFPFVNAIATLFGFGGLLLAAWHVLRPETPPAAPVAWAQPAPNPG
jgi:hypothetical protein